MSDNKSFMKAWQVERLYLTSGHLKVIACIAMFLSHLAQSGLLYMMEFTKTADLFMLIGRISMPLFSFMAVQGIILSKNREKYLKRLFIFALVSEIPFDLAFSGFFMTDYDSRAIVVIGLMYLAKESRLLTAIAILIGFAFEARIGGDYLSIPYMVYLSIPLIFLYNGKRGTYNKWYFYAFYPVHLILIYLLKIILL